jgi:hypothetical protein
MEGTNGRSKHLALAHRACRRRPDLSDGRTSIRQGRRWWRHPQIQTDCLQSQAEYFLLLDIGGVYSIVVPAHYFRVDPCAMTPLSPNCSASQIAKATEGLSHPSGMPEVGRFESSIDNG